MTTLSLRLRCAYQAVLVAGTLMLAVPAPAQQPTSTLAGRSIEYDAVSIHPHKNGDGGSSWSNTSDGFVMVNVTLKSLISSAFDIRDYLVSGPAWLDSTHVDVTAKVAGEDLDAYKKLGEKDRNIVMQKMLADRFKVKTHIETKVLPVYDLVLAKGGSKLIVSGSFTPNPEHPDWDGSMMTMYPGRLDGERMRLPFISTELGYLTQRPVIDKTGLTGQYTLKLHWTSEDAKPTDSSDAAPELFTAVQEQLGLKLVPSKGPVETLVVDHAELPTEN